MEIEGPLKYKIVNYDGSDDQEIHVDFIEEFQNLNLQQQANQFAEHVASLQSKADTLDDDSQERTGLLFVLQFLEELVPHIEAGGIPLDETIIVKVQDQSPLNKLISGLQH